MTGAGSFVYGTCGERHEGCPGLSFAAPFHYAQMTADEQQAQAVLTAD